jgi:two-component system, NtrC family, response regulator AtoC
MLSYEPERRLKPHAPSSAGTDGRLRLLVIGRTRMETIRLPSSGEVRIGRSASCAVILTEPSIGEEHALLRIGRSIALVDLGSGQLTAIGQERLEPGAAATLNPGSVFTLGTLTLVVQVAGASTRLRHVRSHDYFEARVEDECARAEGGSGAGFSVARLVFTPGSAPTIETIFSERLRAMDVVASYAPDEYEILLVDVLPAGARAIVEDLKQRLDGFGVEASVGLASYPVDARNPEALLTAAAAMSRSTVPPPSAPVMPRAAMDRLAAVVTRVAPSNMSVLILGETGVGKEVTAKAIHRMSPRAAKRMLCINCAAFTENLLESELFGYERGAFTGAVSAKQGLLETAAGGTVFLDEIGEMPLTIQAKLLRVLEDRQVSRLGALAPRAIDVRFVSATNRDLEQQVELGLFRRDLYFRLNGFLLEVPPLRERGAEIPTLAGTFIEEACALAGRDPVPTLSQAALAALERYAWPGNVRELRNVIERAVLLCTDSEIDVTHLPMDKMGRTLPPASAPALPRVGTRRPPASLDASRGPPEPARAHSRLDSRADDAREQIVWALSTCGGNQTKAAKLLGIARNTLITRLDELGLPRPKKPS